MHHKRFSFQDEYRQFLLSYGVEYDEAYVFKDEGFCPYRARRLYYAENPGCRFACPGLCAPLGLQPALAKSAPQGVASLAICSTGLLLTSSAAAQQFKQA